MLSLEYILKQKPVDFQVTEVQNLILNGGDYSIYYMFKVGMRTWDCVHIIAASLDVDIKNIDYAGLKDEDGMTAQYISIYKKRIDRFEHKFGESQYFFIQYMGDRDLPFRIGRLMGNCFKIRLRNITSEDLDAYAGHTNSFLFINYYDTQRFGLPNQKKVTHLIGQKIIEGDFQQAMFYLLQSGNIRDEEATHFGHNAEKYFFSLDNRMVNFYLSAYDSFIWNRGIMDILRCNDDVVGIYEKDGFEFLTSDLMYTNQYDLHSKIIRHERNESKEITSRESTRLMYYNVVCKVSDFAEDDLHLGKCMVDMDFFLPPGSYATTLVDQMLYWLYYKRNL